MAAPVRLGRKRPLPACPNPLFVRWLREWRDQAAAGGRRTRFVFQKALLSLKRYPLPLRSGKEAKILQHFGDGLCRMLDQRLQQHRAAGGDHAPGSPTGSKTLAGEGPSVEAPDASVPVRTVRGSGGGNGASRARFSDSAGAGGLERVQNHGRLASRSQLETPEFKDQGTAHSAALGGSCGVSVFMKRSDGKGGLGNSLRR